MNEKYDDVRFRTNYAIVTAVVREGPDVFMTLTNVRPWHVMTWRYEILYTAIVRFANTTRIVSVDTMSPNSDVECRLEPGWQVGGVMTFDGIVARIPFQFVDMHDIITVLHSIYCDTVTMTPRLSIGQTLKRYFFPRSSPTVMREPPPSAPLPGQDRRPPPAPVRETVY